MVDIQGVSVIFVKIRACELTIRDEPLLFWEGGGTILDKQFLFYPCPCANFYIVKPDVDIWKVEVLLCSPNFRRV